MQGFRYKITLWYREKYKVLFLFVKVDTPFLYMDYRTKILIPVLFKNICPVLM